MVSHTLKNFFLLLLSIGLTNLVHAQDVKENKKEKATSIKTLLDSKSFVFKAQSALPTIGTTRQLTSDYDLRLTGDTLQSYLPYFGRAYQAPINPADGGIRFTSTEFEYKLVEQKKGRYEVDIRPKDEKDVRIMHLSVSKNGYASLQVLSNNRQPITFNGYVTAVRKK